MSGDEAVTAAIAAVTEPVAGHSSRLAKEQQQEKVMVHNIRVTEVIHPFSFFAQIGTDQELACFDEYSSSLSLWCEQRSHGVSPTPANAAHIAVRTSSCDETTEGGGGGWSRAVVTKVVDPKSGELECYLLDVGVTRIVQVSDVCCQCPPMMFSMAAQALSCKLIDVQMLTGSDSWLEKAITRFRELAAGRSVLHKAIVYTLKDNIWPVSIIVKTATGWIPLGRLLAKEELVNYLPIQSVLQAVKSLNAQESGTHIYSLLESAHMIPLPDSELDLPWPSDSTAHSDQQILLSDTSHSSSLQESISQRVADASNKKLEVVSSKGTNTSLVLSSLAEPSEHKEDKSVPGKLKNSIVSEEVIATVAPKKPSIPQTGIKQMRGVSVTIKPHMKQSEVAMTKKVEQEKEKEEKEEDRDADKSDSCEESECKAVSNLHFTRENEYRYLSQLNAQEQRKRASLQACYAALMSESNTRQPTPPSSNQKRKSYRQRKPRPERACSFSPRRGHGPNIFQSTPGMPTLSKSCAGRGRGLLLRREQRKLQTRGFNFTEQTSTTLKHQLNTIPCPTSLPPSPLPPPSPPLSLSSVIEDGRSSERSTFIRPEQKRSGEMEWLSNVVVSDTNKVIDEISGVFNPSQFVEKVISGNSAHRLGLLSGSSGLMRLVLQTVIQRAIRDLPLMEVMIQAVIALYDYSTDNVSNCLQAVLEQEAMKKHSLFCVFLAKLYFSSLGVDSETMFPLVGDVVRHFLDTWVKCAPGADEQTSVTHAELFAKLCGEIGPTLDASSREILDEYFEKAVRENILQGMLPRSCREVLLDLCFKRSAWIERVHHESLSHRSPNHTDVPTSTGSLVQTPRSHSFLFVGSQHVFKHTALASHAPTNVSHLSSSKIPFLAKPPLLPVPPQCSVQSPNVQQHNVAQTATSHVVQEPPTSSSNIQAQEPCDSQHHLLYSLEAVPFCRVQTPPHSTTGSHIADTSSHIVRSLHSAQAHASVWAPVPSAQASLYGGWGITTDEATPSLPISQNPPPPSAQVPPPISAQATPPIVAHLATPPIGAQVPPFPGAQVLSPIIAQAPPPGAQFPPGTQAPPPGPQASPPGAQAPPPPGTQAPPPGAQVSPPIGALASPFGATAPFLGSQTPLGDQVPIPYKSASTYSLSAATPSTNTKPHGQYNAVAQMLQDLDMECLLDKFHEAMIQDSQLLAPRDDLKSTLKEAGVPSGAVLAILQYTDARKRQPSAISHPQQSHYQEHGNPLMPNTTPQQSCQVQQQRSNPWSSGMSAQQSLQQATATHQLSETVTHSKPVHTGGRDAAHTPCSLCGSYRHHSVHCPHRT